MWTYLLIFIFAALFGFVYGKKAHLKQLSNILLQQGMPIDQVSKLSECVRTYNKTIRQAKKETREEFKKMLVESQLKKMKEGGEKKNG